MECILTGKFNRKEYHMHMIDGRNSTSDKGGLWDIDFYLNLFDESFQGSPNSIVELQLFFIINSAESF